MDSMSFSQLFVTYLCELGGSAVRNNHKPIQNCRESENAEFRLFVTVLTKIHWTID